jgi:hypothetical protein
LEVLTVREPSEYSEALPRPEIERAVIQLASEVDGVAELGLEGEVLLIEGKGFYGTAVGPFVRIGGVEAEIVLLLSGSRIVTTIPSTARGATEFVVINPDGRRVEGAIESATSQSGEGRRR